MRFDEWNKFLETQFVDEKCEAVVVAIDAAAPPAQPTPMPVDAQTVEIGQLSVSDEPANEPVNEPVNDDGEPISALHAAAGDYSVLIPVWSHFTPAANPDDATYDSLPDTERAEAGDNHGPASRRQMRTFRPKTPAPANVTSVELCARVPRHVLELLALDSADSDSEDTPRSTRRRPTESRRELIARILDPILPLEDAAKLLGVCPATARRYANRGMLTYYRRATDRPDGLDGSGRPVPRSFRLTDVLAFMKARNEAAP